MTCGASQADREAFLRMIHDAQQPGCPFQYILVYDVKRFGRLDNDETGHYRYLLGKAAVEVVYVRNRATLFTICCATLRASRAKASTSLIVRLVRP